MARALLGLIRDRNGTWCVQRKVPELLQTAVARVLNNGKRKQVHLKKSLGTKDLKTANIRATSVIASFDRTIVRALQDIEKRNAGEVVATPKLNPGALSTQAAGGGTLRDAFEGWKLERAPSAGTLASHLVGPDPFLRDQLVSFRFSKFAIAAPVLKLGQPALLIVVVVSHGS